MSDFGPLSGSHGRDSLRPSGERRLPCWPVAALCLAGNTEYREACYFLDREEEGPMAGSLEGLYEGSITRATRRLLTRAREEWRYDVLERNLEGSQEGKAPQQFQGE